MRPIDHENPPLRRHDAYAYRQTCTGQSRSIIVWKVCVGRSLRFGVKVREGTGNWHAVRRSASWVFRRWVGESSCMSNSSTRTNNTEKRDETKHDNKVSAPVVAASS